LLHYKKSIIFAIALVRKCRSAYSTKRESGENPEQTRYCKSYATFLTTPLPLSADKRDGKAAQKRG